MSHTVHTRAIIPAPIEEVWNLLGNFASLPSYHPWVVSGFIENGAPNNLLGCIRYLRLQSGYVREKLLLRDTANHCLHYSMIEGSLPVHDYYAAVCLVPDNLSKQTHGEWWADFVVAEGDKTAVTEQIAVAFKAGFEGAAEKLAKISLAI